MFQQTLLIIKSDYLHKRKALLIYLLRQGFQIQGQRKILFTPELAAEFCEDLADDPCFMFQVILLSKGNSEAFILAKECAVEDLFNLMMCHFGSSTEMEKNVHVTKCQIKVGREISFIFPNYIHEPIYCRDQIKFCADNPLAASLIGKLYDILTKTEKDSHKGWKEKLAEWLILSNKSLPHVSNRCCRNPNLNLQEIAQQTKISFFKNEKTNIEATATNSFTDVMNFQTDGASINITSSSCMSCSGFGSEDECRKQLYKQPSENIIKAKKALLTAIESFSSLEIRNVEENDATEWLTENYSREEISKSKEVEYMTTKCPLTPKGEDVYEDSIKADDVEEPGYDGANGDHVESLIGEEGTKYESEPIQTIKPVIFDKDEPIYASEDYSIEKVAPAEEDISLPGTDDAAPPAE